MRVDQSSISGESDSIKKDGLSDPFLLSGSKVMDGVGSMLAVAVGENSINGRIIMSLGEAFVETPLQIKLEHLAENIAKCGFLLAIAMLTLLTFKLIHQIFTESLYDIHIIIQRLLVVLIQTIVSTITLVITY